MNYQPNNRSYDKLRNMGDVGAMTQLYAIKQDIECIVPIHTQTNMEDEFSRLEDESCRIQNDIIAYENQLAMLHNEQITLERRRNVLISNRRRPEGTNGHKYQVLSAAIRA